MSYLSLITPTNIAEEREKFFSSTTYSPQLEYKWDNVHIQKYKKDPALLELTDALISGDNNQITSAAELYFNIKFLDDDILKAKEFVKVVPDKIHITPEEYAELANKKFTEFEVGYKAKVVDKHGFQGRPNHKTKMLSLSKYLNPDFLTVDGLVNHELVHIIRAVNGEHNGIEVQQGYLATEEGLASFIQDKQLKETTASVFQHALEYLAAYIARDCGFREVYDFLIAHGSSPDNAWLRGIRQKFGIRDTAKPGSLMKSAMCFYHELKVSTLRQDELTRLFIGKIEQTNLANFPTYNGKIPIDKIHELLN